MKFINLSDKESKRTSWVLFFISKNTNGYFDSFLIEHIPADILNKIKDKSITYKIFRIQSNDFGLCGFYCTTFKKWSDCRKKFDYTNLLSSNNYEKNNKIKFKYLKDTCGKGQRKSWLLTKQIHKQEIIF